jgi:hypothetical protein
MLLSLKSLLNERFKMNTQFMIARAGGKTRARALLRKVHHICITGRKDGNKLGKRKRELYCGVIKTFAANPHRAIRRPHMIIIDDLEKD